MVGVKRLLAQSSSLTIGPRPQQIASSCMGGQASSVYGTTKSEALDKCVSHITGIFVDCACKKGAPAPWGGRMVKVYFFLLLWSPGASSLAFVAPVSCLMSPGAFPDFPGSSDPLGTGWWPGELADTPWFGEPLPAAWASCEATVAATSAAAHITIFLRAM